MWEEEEATLLAVVRGRREEGRSKSAEEGGRAAGRRLLERSLRAPEAEEAQQRKEGSMLAVGQKWGGSARDAEEERASAVE